jgi:hypothetical protein
MKLRGELRTIERAIRQGWKTSPDVVQRSVDLALSTLGSDAHTSREKQAALRVLDALIQHDGATDAEVKKRAADALRYHAQRRVEHG